MSPPVPWAWTGLTFPPQEAFLVCFRASVLPVSALIPLLNTAGPERPVLTQLSCYPADTHMQARGAASAGAAVGQKVNASQKPVC